MEHKPNGWKVVVQTDKCAQMSAMCVCGNDDCWFTVVAYPSDWVHVTE